MYAQRNGSLSFSFNRLMMNAFPNFASDNPLYADFSPQRQDMLYSYQISLPEPLLLASNAFYVAGSVDNERRSDQVHRALQKNGVLTAEGKVDSTKIGPKFIHRKHHSNPLPSQPDPSFELRPFPPFTPFPPARSPFSSFYTHQPPLELAFVDHMSQKNLINVLFFWEEEARRLAKLSAEATELNTLIEAAESSAANPAAAASAEDAQHTQTLDQLRFARERVHMKIRQKPSERRSDVEGDRDTMVRDAFRADASTQAQTQDLPPSYHPPAAA